MICYSQEGKIKAREKIRETIDKERLAKIRRILSKIEKPLREKYPEFFTGENLKFLKSVYQQPLKKIYGDEWIVLAVMYELFDKKKRGYGFDRKSNRNPTGLLISMAWKEKGASFEEFLSKFCKLFGLKLKSSKKVKFEKEIPEKTENGFFEKVKKLMAFKAFMKGKVKEITTYKVLFEDGLNGIKEENEKVILVFKESYMKHYAQKYVSLISEFFGKAIEFQTL